MTSISIEKSRKIALILLDIGAVLFRPNQPFKFDSGILSPVYVDNRYLNSYPLEREEIINTFIELIRKKIGKVDVIAGVATAGITYAAWIAQILKLPLIYVRSKPKDHGRQNQVEGFIKRGSKVLIVEDLVSTVGSSIRVVKVLRSIGAKVSDIVTIYSHNLEESNRIILKSKVKLHFLTDTKTVARVAFEKGYLKKGQVELISRWVNDPNDWAKKVRVA